MLSLWRMVCFSRRFKDAFDDNHHQEYLQWYKGQVAHHINEDMADIPEDEIVNKIDQTGEGNKDESGDEENFIASHLLACFQISF